MEYNRPSPGLLLLTEEASFWCDSVRIKTIRYWPSSGTAPSVLSGTWEAWPEVSRRLEMLVLSWLVLQTTDSPFQLGLVLVFNNLPRPLFSLFAGLVADRFSRRRILFAAQGVNTLLAVVILALIWQDQLATWHIFLAVFLQGITKSLEDPSRRTAILDIVGEGRLVNALSLDTMSNTIGKMIGPLLGGGLNRRYGVLGSIRNYDRHPPAGLGLSDPGLEFPRADSMGASPEAVWRSLGSSLALRIAFPNTAGNALYHYSNERVSLSGAAVHPRQWGGTIWVLGRPWWACWWRRKASVNWQALP